MLETAREKHISICCTSYASYTQPNERNCVAVIEQGKNYPMVEKKRKWVPAEREKNWRKIVWLRLKEMYDDLMVGKHFH
ncbi:hypothetical protein Bca4012_073216 [Brassica carinata]